MVALNLPIKNLSAMLYNDPWLSRLSKLLESRIHKSDFNLKELADLMNISERQLHRKVKRVTSLTPNKFFRTIRLQKAKELLESGELQTVQEVGQAVGYTNIHYFSQHYEKCYGETPMEVLKRLGLR